MATKWNKIYRGGVHRNTPETREVDYTGSETSILPGTFVVLAAATGVALGAPAGSYPYVVGEQLHGSVDDNQIQTDSEKQASLRLYEMHSGDLFAGRAAAGIALVDDLPLTVNASGYLAVATVGTDRVVAYVDDPTSAYARTPTPTTAGQLIPIKIL